MPFKATAEQRLAINTDGNVLVAAAAGSGKTAVLVERVLRLLNDPVSPINADELLIVTFTNAAAAEMRARIEKKLGEVCAQQPDNKRLREQRHLLPSAKICTIDSFCIDLVRENFERCGVSPDFRVADESAMQPLRDAAFTAVINRFFSENPSGMRELMDILGADYDDRSFKSAVGDIFSVSRNQPFPELYLRELASAGDRKFDSEHPWFKEGVRQAKTRLINMINAAETAVGITENANAKRTAGYIRALEEMTAQLGNMLLCAENNDWDGLFRLISNYDHSPLRGTSTGGLPELEAVKSIIEENGKKQGKKALLRIIFASSDDINRQSEKLREPVRLLVRFVEEYAAELFSLQQQENLYTFYNTEQSALSMLCEQRNGEICLKEDAQHFLSRYRAVLVDEYQDTNDLQNMLFNVLSGNGERLFAVGDVKQSIYAFRGANPENFLERKNLAKPAETAKPGDAKKIILARNFRSRRGICDYINFFFGRLMTEELGRLAYNSEEMLIPENAFPENGRVCSELLVIDRKSALNSSEDDSESPAALAAEARAIAEYIRRTLAAEPFLKGEDGKLRSAQYGDFAILMRNQKNRSALLAEELRRCGIPVSFSKENFLESLEIRTFSALLGIIDNPKQDTALLTAMMSPIFGFSAEETAEIRAGKPDGSLLSAVTAAAEAGNVRAASFLSRISGMRTSAVTLPLPRLLSSLLADTDYLNLVSAMPDGSRRRSNLLLLCDLAAGYTRGGNGTLGGFLRMLGKMPAGSMRSAKAGGGSNAVRLMSMHASKGLQFPICILCDLGVDMHKNTERQNLLFSPEDGIGFRYFDEQLKEDMISPAYCVLLNKTRRERLAEELRLLYVAMTRAEEKLVMVSYNKNLADSLTRISASLLANGGNIGQELFGNTSSMNDWILMTSLLHINGAPLREIGGIPLEVHKDSSSLNIEFISGTPAANADTSSEIEIKPDFQLADRLRKNFSFEYEYAPLLEIEAKSTVSRIANSAESESFSFTAKPAVLENGGFSAADRGTATHRVMQFIRFSEHPDLKAELERLLEWQFISEAQFRAVDSAAIEKFFGSDIYHRILSGSDVRREMRFLTELPAGQLHPELSGQLADENIVVQGAVDLCFKEADGIVVLDFKTDRVTSEKALAEAYGEQLSLYAAACRKIFGLPVKEKILYSFALGKEIEV